MTTAPLDLDALEKLFEEGTKTAVMMTAQPPAFSRLMSALLQHAPALIGLAREARALAAMLADEEAMAAEKRAAEAAEANATKSADDLAARVLAMDAEMIELRELSRRALALTTPTAVDRAEAAEAEAQALRAAALARVHDEIVVRQQLHEARTALAHADQRLVDVADKYRAERDAARALLATTQERLRTTAVAVHDLAGHPTVEEFEACPHKGCVANAAALSGQPAEHPHATKVTP